MLTPTRRQLVMRLPAEPPTSVVGSARQTPHRALMTPELVDLIAEHLQPDDFVAMTQVCRRWRDCQDITTLAQKISAKRRLMPAPLYDFNPGRAAIGPSDAFGDILHERHLLQKIKDGPIKLQGTSLGCTWEASGSLRYVSHRMGDIDNTSVYRLGPDGPIKPALLQLPGPASFSWCGTGSHAVLRDSHEGPIKWLSLTGATYCAELIAPRATFDYDEGLMTPDGNCFIAACSDANLRVFRRNNKGLFGLTSVVALGNIKTAEACSADGRTLALSHDEQGLVKIDIFHDAGQGTYRLLGTREYFGACCLDIKVSPLGHFAQVEACMSGDTFSIHADAQQGAFALWNDVAPVMVLSIDETQCAQLCGEHMSLYRWPTMQPLDEPGHGAQPVPAWLQPYLDWRKRTLALHVSSHGINILGELHG